MKTKVMLSVAVVGLLLLPMLAAGTGVVDVGRFMGKQSVAASCKHCVDDFLFDTYSCTSCNIENADCYKLIVAGTYACCTNTVKPRLCEDISYNPSAPNAVLFAWAQPSQPCRPRDLCPDCPTGVCVHAPQPSEECLPAGESQYENGTTFCGT
ncbi:MAG: hypothetical protein P9L94_20585 [Candidatus Hinthialibacter antarcticus]|nr:hypothetical protein [Candidatus Hinthialibacter antarcticus]